MKHLLIFRKDPINRGSAVEDSAGVTVDFLAVPFDNLVNISATYGEIILYIREANTFESSKANLAQVALSIEPTREIETVKKLWSIIREDNNRGYIEFNSPIRQFPVENIREITSIKRFTTERFTSGGKTYTISCVDGDNSDEEKIRLTDSDGTTDDVVLEAGTGMSIARSGDKITFTNTVSDTNTQLTTEEVQDIVGAMLTGNTETRISVTYDDTDGTIDFVVDDMSSSGYKLLQTYSYSDTGTTDKFFVQNAITEVSGTNAARDYRSAYAIPVAGSIGDCTMVGASAINGNAYRLYVWVNNTSTYYAEATGGDEAGARYTVRWTAWKNVSDDSDASDPSFSANDYLAFQLVPTGVLANPGSVSLSVLTSHT